WSCLLVGLFCGLTIYSCLSLRLAPRHGKDDYRSAAKIAKDALQAGRAVWWNAAKEGARYYEVPLKPAPAAADAGVVALTNPSRDLLEHLPEPDVIIASKPDLFDNAAAVQGYLREHNFERDGQVAAFVIWRQKKR